MSCFGLIEENLELSHIRLAIHTLMIALKLNICSNLLGPVPNQKMAVFGFEILGLKLRNFSRFEPNYKSAQQATKPKIEFILSVVADQSYTIMVKNSITKLKLAVADIWYTRNQDLRSCIHNSRCHFRSSYLLHTQSCVYATIQ